MLLRLSDAALVAMLPPALATEKPRAAGMPVLHTEIRIVDDLGADRPAGETGEILVRGPQVMAGYWGDDAATEAALAGGWLHTGDLGRLDEDGLLEIVDRKNDLIIAGGLNVYPAEIERVLAEFPGMVEAAVVGVADRRWGEVPAAIVRGAGPVDEAAVVAHCRRLLADYKTPRHVVVVDEPLPRSMSGKVLRRELRAKYQGTRGAPPPEDPPKTPRRQEYVEMPVKFGTVDFYQAMADQLNGDPAWGDIGKDLSYTMVYVFTEPVDKRFYAAFDEGKVTGVREATDADAEVVDFVITGPPDVWRGIFEKKINPTAALTTGKMKVKGKMTTLLKNMKAFSYVIEAMTKVDFE